MWKYACNNEVSAKDKKNFAFSSPFFKKIDKNVTA